MSLYVKLCLPSQVNINNMALQVLILSKWRKADRVDVSSISLKGTLEKTSKVELKSFSFVLESSDVCCIEGR